jgi:spore maturation protein CgeB
MRIALFCHSLVSDWNHGNAHFLRGVVAELAARGHDVRVHEPAEGWSRTNLVAARGAAALDEAAAAFPGMASSTYRPRQAEVAALAEGADLVIVHEWNDPEVVRWIGRHRAAGGYRLLFHDTHHRSVSAPAEMARYDLSGYDGVLAFGAAVRDVYLREGWAARAWTWHEAADVRTFAPREGVAPQGDLVWVGNWGDGERGEELREFLVEPVRQLRLRANVYGVRYPDRALAQLQRAGAHYRGFVQNHRVPEVFAAHRVTVHVPRRPYATALPGIPTIRVFEALACGIPLVCAPWDDAEHLFRPGRDYLVARDGAEMRACLAAVLEDPDLAATLAAAGLETVRSRHTCAHRVDELLAICSAIGLTAEVGHG